MGAVRAIGGCQEENVRAAINHGGLKDHGAVPPPPCIQAQLSVVAAIVGVWAHVGDGGVAAPVDNHVPKHIIALGVHQGGAHGKGRGHAHVRGHGGVVVRLPLHRRVDQPVLEGHALQLLGAGLGGKRRGRHHCCGGKVSHPGQLHAGGRARVVHVVQANGEGAPRRHGQAELCRQHPHSGRHVVPLVNQKVVIHPKQHAAIRQHGKVQQLRARRHHRASEADSAVGGVGARRRVQRGEEGGDGCSGGRKGSSSPLLLLHVAQRQPRSSKEADYAQHRNRMRSKAQHKSSKHSRSCYIERWHPPPGVPRASFLVPSLPSPQWTGRMRMR